MRQQGQATPPGFDHYFSEGWRYHQFGQQNEAIACYRKALAFQPDHAAVWNNIGSIWLAQGNPAEATYCLRKAVELKLDYTDAYNNLGLALREQGQLAEAIEAFEKAVETAPEQSPAYNNLGATFSEQGQIAAALDMFQKAIQLNPSFPEPHTNMRNLNTGLGLIEEGIRNYEAAVRVNPSSPEAHGNLGFGFFGMGRAAEAIASYRRAIELKPDYADAHANLGMALLSQGDMLEGWREYELRWRTQQLLHTKRKFAQPQWYGEPSIGRTILIHAEQGFGDTLQFCRYVPLLAARGMGVVLEVPKPLVSLLSRLQGVTSIVELGHDLPPFDLHCPLLSLPMAFGTTLNSIPRSPSYLSAPEGKEELVKTRLFQITGDAFRVGLVWAGNPRSDSPIATATDRLRSMPFEKLAALLQVRNVQFVNLQRDSDIALEAFGVIDLMNGVADFSDTAAIVANLDLVVSVDTAVAHLAAAMGKPVWMLDRFAPCWRWLTGRLDSPWYPTLRLYRQPQPGDWDAVVAAVTNDLHHFVLTPQARGVQPQYIDAT